MRRLAFGLAALALLAACSSSGGGEVSPAPAPVPSPPTTSPVQPTETDSGEPTVATTDFEAMELVVREWSRLLNAGDNEGAAMLFQLPALIAQGGVVARLGTYTALAQWHSSLPCSGTVLSVEPVAADAVEAVFELGHRLTSRCDAEPGTLAAAIFVFRDGKIVGWQQVAPPEQAAPPEEETEPPAEEPAV